VVPLVIEPISKANFCADSYGFRPRRSRCNCCDSEATNLQLQSSIDAGEDAGALKNRLDQDLAPASLNRNLWQFRKTVKFAFFRFCRQNHAKKTNGKE
jgi:hypothetical protein